MRPLIIYHGGCPDGFCAAWVAHKALKAEGRDAELWPARYADAPPNVEGREVYIVDFSYPRALIEEMHAKAQFLQVIDHHQTAEKNLEGLDYCIFDMNESGASLTWKYFHPDLPNAWLVDYVRDRDLWKFELEDSEAISAYLMAVPQTIAAWDELAETPAHTVAERGMAIRMHIRHYIARTRAHAFLISIDGVELWCVNAPYMNISDLLHDLAMNPPGVAPMYTMGRPRKKAALGFFWRGDGWQYSLRSADGTNIAAIAEKRGGGGHKDAAGFESDELIPEIQSALAVHSTA